IKTTVATSTNRTPTNRSRSSRWLPDLGCRQKGSEMRVFMASLIVLLVLYFWDRDYNNGKLMDGLAACCRAHPSVCLIERGTRIPRNAQRARRVIAGDVSSEAEILHSLFFSKLSVLHRYRHAFHYREQIQARVSLCYTIVSWPSWGAN